MKKNKKLSVSQPDLEEGKIEKGKESKVTKEIKTKTSDKIPKKISQLQKKMADLSLQAEKKLAEYEDMVKRQKAEFDNYRKRVIEERENVIKYASEELLKEFLNIFDLFEKAVDVETKDVELKKYIEGFRLIKEQMDKMLVKHGVKLSTNLGDVFNPEYHQVIQVQNEGGKVEKIEDIYQKGYFLHDRLLREAVVKTIKTD